MGKIMYKNINYSGASGIELENAKAGQVIIIKAVDENGVPTEYEGMDVVDGNTALFYADGNEVAY